MKLAMKSWVPALLDGLHLLALAVWLGGLVTLWLAVMPAAFQASGLTVREAETVVGNCLRGFTGLVEMCGIAMAGAQFALRRRYQAVRALFVADGIRQLLTFGALLLAEFNLRMLLPQMDAARQQANVKLFHDLHQNYALLATFQAIILIAVGVITAWLQSPRLATTPIAGSEPLLATKVMQTPPNIKPADVPGTKRTEPRPSVRNAPKVGRRR